MVKCVECQKDMIIIGTEKFKCNDYKDRKNWQVMENQMYLIFTVWYCKSCDIVMLREPKYICG